MKKIITLIVISFFVGSVFAASYGDRKYPDSLKGTEDTNAQGCAKIGAEIKPNYNSFRDRYGAKDSAGTNWKALYIIEEGETVAGCVSLSGKVPGRDYHRGDIEIYFDHFDNYNEALSAASSLASKEIVPDFSFETAGLRNPNDKIKLNYRAPQNQRTPGHKKYIVVTVENPYIDEAGHVFQFYKTQSGASNQMGEGRYQLTSGKLEKLTPTKVTAHFNGEATNSTLYKGNFYRTSFRYDVSKIGFVQGFISLGTHKLGWNTCTQEDDVIVRIVALKKDDSSVGGDELDHEQKHQHIYWTEPGHAKIKNGGTRIPSDGLYVIPPGTHQLDILVYSKETMRSPLSAYGYEFNLYRYK